MKCDHAIHFMHHFVFMHDGSVRSMHQCIHAEDVAGPAATPLPSRPLPPRVLRHSPAP